MAQLAIKGHATRGGEVIEILEMLGGINTHTYSADNDSLCFYLNKNTNIIYYVWVDICYEDILVFTLEEFLEKFPYKVGESVSSKYLKNYKIEKAVWKSGNNKVIYKLQGMGWYSVEELEPYKEETIDKANKAVFGANAQCCDIMNDIIKKDMKEIKIDIPAGYEFAGVDDDKNQVVFTKIGYHYPKTYEECCKALGKTSSFCFEGISLDEVEKIRPFIKLLRCRDAYWKIAGEQLGLGKPWKQDYCNRCFIIANNKGNIHIYEYHGDNNVVLAFPIKEMRDAFKKNFDNDIECCKEFL